MPNTLQQTLSQAAEGLLFPSESDYPLTFFEWTPYRGKRLPSRTVLRLLEKPPDTPVERKSLEAFFQPVTKMQDWFGEEEKANVGKFVALEKTLRAQLQNIAVFRLGKIEIQVYIAGKTPEGHWAGLSTTVIET
jgi:hypothetical protein